MKIDEDNFISQLVNKNENALMTYFLVFGITLIALMKVKMNLKTG